MPQKAARTAIAALAVEAGVDTDAPGIDEAESAASVTRRRSRRRQATAPPPDPWTCKRWSRCCGTPPVPSAARRTQPSSRTTCCRFCSSSASPTCSTTRSTGWPRSTGDRAIAQEIAENDHELLRFYLPPEARWGVVSGRETHDWPLDTQGRSTHPRDIGEHLTLAVRAVVRYNPTLSGVIDLVDFASERNGERDLNPARLAAVVETFSNPRYRLGLADVQPDFLGRAYEYLLKKFAEGSGQSAGEFFTPTEVGFLMATSCAPAR